MRRSGLVRREGRYRLTAQLRRLPPARARCWARAARSSVPAQRESTRSRSLDGGFGVRLLDEAQRAPPLRGGDALICQVALHLSTARIEARVIARAAEAPCRSARAGARTRDVPRSAAVARSGRGRSRAPMSSAGRAPRACPSPPPRSAGRSRACPPFPGGDSSRATPVETGDGRPGPRASSRVVRTGLTPSTKAGAPCSVSGASRERRLGSVSGPEHAATAGKPTLSGLLGLISFRIPSERSWSQPDTHQSRSQIRRTSA